MYMYLQGKYFYSKHMYTVHVYYAGTIDGFLIQRNFGFRNFIPIDIFNVYV